MTSEIKGLLTRYEQADDRGELVILAEELRYEDLLWLYVITKCEVLGDEIDIRKGKSDE